ncbi:MAG TPA: RHS repeat-associated core domain-containing protein, partial [Bauldia sp.]|nr:RHS repeat-associated core domain-containing protein [Bauldia sp.]
NELTSITYAKSGTTLGDVDYTYDTAGRVASRFGTLFKSVLPAATTAAATYNADNQLTSWNGSSGTPTYDLNGNLTNDGSHAFTWDARNRMTAVTGTASFVYDAVGRRLSVTQGATTTAAVYDGYDPVQEQSPIGTVAANLQTGLGTDQRFTRTVSGTASYYLTDLLGSTVGITNATGTAVQTTYSYDPYGVTTQAGTANTNPYKFTGRQDDGTGLYYLRARYYSPAWGRFVSEDPLSARSFNEYVYSGSDPVDGIDPSGLLTLQIGYSGVIDFGPIKGSFGGGIAIDSHGNIGTYSVAGGGVGAGAGSSLGFTVNGSTGNSICDLGGAFVNTSVDAGLGASAGIDAFAGYNRAGDQPVVGGGFTVGAGAGGGAYAGGTWTKVRTIVWWGE